MAKTSILKQVQNFYNNVKTNEVSNAIHIKNGTSEVTGQVIDTIKFCKAFSEFHLASFTTVERYLRLLKAVDKR